MKVERVVSHFWQSRGLVHAPDVPLQFALSLLVVY